MENPNCTIFERVQTWLGRERLPEKLQRQRFNMLPVHSPVDKLGNFSS